MLVLDRRMGQDVWLKYGEIKILVRVLDIERGRVRLGFDAPLEVAIERGELNHASDNARTDGRPS